MAVCSSVHMHEPSLQNALYSVPKYVPVFMYCMMREVSCVHCLSISVSVVLEIAQLFCRSLKILYIC